MLVILLKLAKGSLLSSSLACSTSFCALLAFSKASAASASRCMAICSACFVCTPLLYVLYSFQLICLRVRHFSVKLYLQRLPRCPALVAACCLVWQSLPPAAPVNYEQDQPLGHVHAALLSSLFQNIFDSVI